MNSALSTFTHRVLPPVVLLVGLLTILQLAIVIGEIPPFLMPSPITIGEEFVEYFPIISSSTIVTGTNALIGLVLAFFGVGLTVLTGNGTWDAIGTLGIGVLLILVAIVLGIETKSLLVGEGASAEDLTKIRSVITNHPDVEALIHIKTLYVGPEELLVGAKVAFAATNRLTDVAASINSVESDIREAVPIARIIYIEPDVYVHPGEGNPSTDAIVIRSAD